MSILFGAYLLLSFASVSYGFSSVMRSQTARSIRASHHQLRSTGIDYVQTLKSNLLKISARTNRGELATDAQIETALDLVTQLESMNPSFADEAEGTEHSMEGTWDLVFTDAELFQSSPVFLTIRELFGEDAGKAKQAFQLHRAATNTGEIGAVQQVITSSKLTSKVAIRNGLIPGAPFSLRGDIISTADLTIIDRYSMKLSMKETSVQNSNMPFGIGAVLGVATIPVGQLMKTVMGNLPECNLSTFYLDGDFRITRNKDDNVFVYLRDNSEK